MSAGQALTWYPCGRRLLGPVMYVQRAGGRPTGLFFIVTRLRYWQICGLVGTRELPLIGRLARRALAQIRVEYQWTWLHGGGSGEA